MNATKAIKTYFEQHPHGRKVDAKELIAFKNAVSPAEYAAFGEGCCEILGESYEPPEEKAA